MMMMMVMMMMMMMSDDDDDDDDDDDIGDNYGDDDDEEEDFGDFEESLRGRETRSYCISRLRTLSLSTFPLTLQVSISNNYYYSISINSTLLESMSNTVTNNCMDFQSKHY